MSEQKFTGHIGRTIFDTEYQFETIDRRPENAPNVVYIVLDDLGFAGLSCYGSSIHTPNLDKLADEGVRFNEFHTTAICSATRASLLTGANHHAAGVSSLIEIPTGTTNNSGHIVNEYATIAEILKEYDYSTYASGKWHLTKFQSPNGPYDQWPLAKGFDRYYGFLTAEADHYHPPLVRDNSYIPLPKTAEEGYHCTTDFTDAAIDFVFNHVNSNPDKPFFLYLAHGAVHSPHQAPKEYIDKYKGAFDEGWDKVRQQWFENQKRIGIIPQDALLTERAEYVPAWDTLTEDQKKLYARYMEVFAGTLEFTDYEIGRFLDYLRSVDVLDNTVVVFISDNGASPEGGVEGRFNRNSGMDLAGLHDEAKFALEHIDELGGPNSFGIYPSGWANVLNTPFQWYKMFTHEGGVKDPMIVRYPKLIENPGSVRTQYHHVSDITPTILDILGVKKPENIKGVHQNPFTGISFKYALEDEKAPNRKHVQYYEIMGNRSIYKDGWKANANHTFHKTFQEDKWELYHVAEDYSEAVDVAEKYPEKVQELSEEFFIEAGKNNVFPMLTSNLVSPYWGFNVPCPKVKREYKNIFKPFQIPEYSGVSIERGSYSITVDINRIHNSEGVLFSVGGRFGGVTFYIKNNILKFGYNANQKKTFIVESNIEVPDGKSTVSYLYEKNDGERVTLFINGKEVGSAKITHQFYSLGCGAFPTIRANYYTEVVKDYEVPFEFTGEIQKLTFETDSNTYDLKKEFEKAQGAD